MKNKLPALLFSLILALGVFAGIAALFPAQATVPCPPKGCPKGACGYTGCGDNCHCRGGCGNWSSVCTWCDPNPCDQVFGDGWSKGGCGGQSNCRERSFSCNCGNGSTTCHKSGGGDHPSEPPPPSNPPPPPSPTPIQPTEIINFVQPSPQAFSQKTTKTVGNTISQVAAQSWICLQTIPCSSGKVQCSGGDLKHRVQVSTKPSSKVVPNKKTYIFECLQTGSSYRCTTGNGALDQQLIGANHLPFIASDYGYQFVTFENGGKPVLQSNPAEVPVSDGDGAIGPFEWESFTTHQAGRVMMAMQSLNDGDNIAGQHGTQKLGTFTFEEQEDQTKCVMIKWDPHGVVFDADTLEPLSGVKVTLLRQGEDGRFAIMDGKELFGGLTNPVMTGEDGAYAFYVPNGTYRLAVSKEGFEPLVVAQVGLQAKEKYPQIWDGGNIITQGRLELRNVAMHKITLIDTSVRFLEKVLEKVEGALR